MTSPGLDLAIVDLLEADPRPTFIVGLPLSPPSSTPGLHNQTLRIAYANPPLRADNSLYDRLIGTEQQQDVPFWTWVGGGDAHRFPDLGRDSGSSFTYLNKCWTRSIILNKWAVVGANNQPSSEDDRRQVRQRPTTSGPLPTTVIDPADSRRPSADSTQDWVLPDFTREHEPYVDIVNGFDWTSTPLGPMTSWPLLLKQSFNQILADSRPLAIYWGNELSTLYNEAFSRKLCGSRYPGLLGKPVDYVWPDFCDEMKQIMHESASKQHSNDEHEWCVFVENADGRPIEMYLRWTVVPITENKRCLGFIHAVMDTTASRLWERRTKMLIELGDMLIMARDVKSYWSKLFQSLATVEPSYDVPVAILYSVEDAPGTPGPEKVCCLEGSLGVPIGHRIIPPRMPLAKNDEKSLCPAFRKAIFLRKPTLLQTKDGTLPEYLLEGLDWRGFEEPCRAAVVFPILPTKDEYVTGLLLLGLNPRRPFDNDYQQYVSLLNQKLTSTLASIILLEEEARRGRNMAEQAAYDQAELQEKLDVRTKEAHETMQKFQSIAEFIPVGMCFGDSRGGLTFANESWHRITGQPGTAPITAEAFLACVVEEDQENVRRAYEELQRNLSITIEFRVRRSPDDEIPLQPPIGSSPSLEKAGLDLNIDTARDRHVLASLKAERGPDGTISQVLACLTDVTLHKKAAEEAIRRAQQAENIKRMAEFAAVGLYDMDLEGRLISANNVFYEFCGVNKTDVAQATVNILLNCVADTDVPALQQTLSKMREDGKTHSTEIRLKTTWFATDSAGEVISAPRCVVATFMPVRNSEGALRSFTGCLSDVSLQRWQLETERQRKDEAIESKRQQVSTRTLFRYSSADSTWAETTGNRSDLKPKPYFLPEAFKTTQ